ncbi:MAG: tRNA (adenosine(37)-N6)-threonylcarbamoyltransferase complex transferase subunit TsaD [Patescibacteria group bacterium]|nr:tRNA (adenosine(37)-N6)-threonylcarbamoyltransferase complex transferase subunit TsaD [Patescibacteria group bacterium]
MRILAIESSADDSGVALVEAVGKFGDDFRFSVLANEIASQHHEEYGGIYPNVAKKEHQKNLPILYEKIRAQHPEKPDVIAVTTHPGLEPCLWAGITFAQKLAEQWGVPVVAVNHLEGHIVMSMMKFQTNEIRQHSHILGYVGMSGRLHHFDFPVLSLLISGGNTQLVLSKEPLRYEVVGRTRDDAAGEAFDKVARMLSLPYPGGPHISRLAAASREHHEMSSHGVRLPRPMLHEDNLDFSFSGLKTAVLRMVEAHKPLSDDMKKAIAREFEDAVADVLVGKTLLAVEQCGVNTVITGGGVSANAHIRGRLANALSDAGVKFFVCEPALSTDNALMIALAGYFRAQAGEYTDAAHLRADGSLSLA